MAKRSDGIAPRQEAQLEHGHPWVDRLAIVLRTMDTMESDERLATLRFIKSKYGKEWPSDSY